MSLYRVIKTIVWFALKPFYRMKVEGRENIPKKGPLLICSNHISNLDPPVVGGAIRRDMFYIAKEELFENKWLGGLLRRSNVFPIKRGMSDRGALKKALNVLRKDKGLVIFPEGTRSKTGQLGEGLSGVGFFALRSDAVVLPCAIIGPYKIFKPVRIVFGKPINMEPFKEAKTDVKTTTAMIMDEIRQLIEKNK